MKPDYTIVRIPKQAHRAMRLHCDKNIILAPRFLQDAVIEKIQRDNAKAKGAR